MKNIPETQQKRVVIVGAGFAGIRLARNLEKNKAFQVVLLDKNNFHQFQPLFYQVATAGLEPSAISFPLRKLFQDKENVHFRMAKVSEINPTEQLVTTDIGELRYDCLVLAFGATTNFFGNENIRKYALPMKSISEAIQLRNHILQNYERALNETNVQKQKALLSIVVVGGGPTGVELAGAIAEMKKFVLPKDYPELDFEKMSITLLEGSNRLLNGMSDFAGENALKYLTNLGVSVQLEALVSNYENDIVSLKGGQQFETKSLLWAAGISANKLKGIPEEWIKQGGRIEVDEQSRVGNLENVFALGDVAFMPQKDYPRGHPQVAQVAIQQADHLYANLSSKKNPTEWEGFQYKDRGSMATVGRNLAVCDLPFMKLRGFLAWLIWLFVHLMAILGTKNKLFIFINWSWNYLTYDQSLRLLIRPPDKDK